MAKLTKIVLNKPTGELKNVDVNPELFKKVVVAINYNNRQWSANTKTRGEVKATGKKPFRQKGTGRARQGTTVAPHHRGGGVVFGPKPKFDMLFKVNKKEKRKVKLALVADLYKSSKVLVMETPKMEAPKTKTVADALKKAGCPQKVTFLYTHQDATDVNFVNAMKSIRNMAGVEIYEYSSVNPLHLTRNRHVIMTDAAHSLATQEVNSYE